MKPGGVVLVLAGVWVLCQVLGGKALIRLGIVSEGTEAAPAAPEYPSVPDRGYNNVPHNPQGYPL